MKHEEILIKWKHDLIRGNTKFRAAISIMLFLFVFVSLSERTLVFLVFLRQKSHISAAQTVRISLTSFESFPLGCQFKVFTLTINIFL